MKKSSYIILLLILIASTIGAGLGYKLLTRHNPEPTIGVYVKDGLIYKDNDSKPFTGTVVKFVINTDKEGLYFLVGEENFLF